VQGPVVFLNVATNFECKLFYTIVYKLIVVDQIMCAGATWLHAVIMFQLLLFGIVWALCIVLALGGEALSR